jgi:hypothetical protein
MITVLVQGNPVAIECPEWCDVTHDRVSELADIAHFSAAVPFGHAASDPDESPVAEVDVYWAPHAPGKSDPRLLIWGQEPNAVELDLAAAVKLLADLTACVGHLSGASALQASRRPIKA